MNDWMPIEAAPRDGKSILATHIGNVAGMMYVCWRASHDSSCLDSESGEYKIAGTDRTFKPTHWQPLPVHPAYAKTSPTPPLNTQDGVDENSIYELIRSTGYVTSGQAAEIAESLARSNLSKNTEKKHEH